MFEQFIYSNQADLIADTFEINTHIEKYFSFDEIFNDIFGRTLCRGKKNEKKSDDKNDILGEKKI